MAFEALGKAINSSAKNRTGKVFNDNGAICLDNTSNPNVNIFAGIKPGTSKKEIQK